jgi:hypothetical protein
MSKRTILHITHSQDDAVTREQSRADMAARLLPQRSRSLHSHVWQAGRQAGSVWADDCALTELTHDARVCDYAPCLRPSTDLGLHVLSKRGCNVCVQTCITSM